MCIVLIFLIVLLGVLLLVPKRDRYCGTSYCSANTSYDPLGRMGGWGVGCCPVPGAQTTTLKEDFLIDFPGPASRCYSLPAESQVDKCLAGCAFEGDTRGIKTYCPKLGGSCGGYMGLL